MSYTPAFISSTSIENPIPIHYANIERINQRNKYLKDWMTKFNFTTEVLDRMVEVEAMSLQLNTLAHKIIHAVAANEGDLISLTQGTGYRRTIIGQFDNIKGALE